jgi:squalene-hopene/tetraprenyl-beta-curcumene cyclase
LSGAVPDADDTAGALLALGNLRASPSCGEADRRKIEASAALGVNWLLNLQNRDGGWPTFCRGWGKLPFDRSGADLTAHAMRALHGWRDALSPSQKRLIERSLKRGWRYLQKQQRADGSWVPLWFGHQDHPEEENPVFGTARVLRACSELGLGDTPTAVRGYRWLESVQRADGGWSGYDAAEQAPRSVEETALAVAALLGKSRPEPGEKAVSRGLSWLLDAIWAGRHTENAPIGFYFAKLWYHERLYPLVFTVAALGQAVRRWAPQASHFRGTKAPASNSEIIPPRE